ncbi:hypothetical protein M433DRAFT_228237 [Acidomyces richmondensis BFW]|nr:MAG: hypothetical protein FE78DRAFT_377344 [Acidomyces sp. 'richmondensis']KYG45981.1 hypothetical protein M433DRAFT_228237 [Acidomyces richmondensis BFW]
MDQLPRGGDGSNNLFADSSHPNHTYDNQFFNGPDYQIYNDASWGLNASTVSGQSRAGQPAVPGWQQNANHLSASPAHGNVNGQASPYARALSHSPAPFGQNPYGGFSSQPSFPLRQQQYDATYFNSSIGGQGYAGSNFGPYGTQHQNHGTIAPQALQQPTRLAAPKSQAQADLNLAPSAVGQSRFGTQPPINTVDQSSLVAAIPKGNEAGDLSIIDFDQLVRATNSERLGNFVNVGKEAHEWPINRTTTLPQYTRRRSKNELRKLAGNDASLLAKIGKKSVKKETMLSALQTVGKPSVPVKGPGSPKESTKHEGDSSSSDESSADDDDSSYTSEEDLEGSPLPSRRSDNPKEAVEYDTIKALWRAKRKPVDAATIKKGIVDFWEIIKTIRDRWKIDSAAVADAEEKKKVGELPLLRSRVKDQRDMIESAFKTALKHGHRSIIELLGENSSLVYLCYQFLLDRFKADDHNGTLARAMLETMSLFTTVDNAMLEKTHLDRVIVRYIKKGDAKTQYYAKRVTQNAAAVSKEKDSAALPPSKSIGSVKNTTGASSPTIKRTEPEPVAGVKRVAGNSGDGGAQKKLAVGVAKTNGTASTLRPIASVKKTAGGGDTSKTSAVPAATITKTKQVTAKPSSFFSSLQSAAKKPGTSIKAGVPAQASGTKLADKKNAPLANAAPVSAPKSTFSFAETMANLQKPKEEKPASTKPEKELPPETPEEKAERLRKEARRKLHVSFKPGEELVQIRYFTHDPEEELGHDASQMRDVADAGGEGRALKLHQDMMDLDEDDDGEEEQSLIPFKEPSQIDFSVVDPEERQKVYSKFGGPLEPESSERVIRARHEANTLMVFYGDENAIPPNPREPSDPYNGDQSIGSKDFGRPEQTWYDRVQERTANRSRWTGVQQQTTSAFQPAFDLAQFMKAQQHQPPAQPPPQTVPPPNIPEIQSLLAKLNQQTLPNQSPPPLINIPSQPAAQSNGQNIDINAILASLTGQQSAPQPLPPGSFGAAGSVPAVINFPSQTQETDQGGAAGSDSRDRKRWRDQGDKNKFYKTKVCRYWQEGRCMKGDSCTYLHEDS